MKKSSNCSKSCHIPDNRLSYSHIQYCRTFLNFSVGRPQKSEVQSFSKEDEKLKNKTLSEISECIKDMLSTKEIQDLEKRCATRVQGVDHLLKAQPLTTEDFQQSNEDLDSNGLGCNKVRNKYFLKNIFFNIYVLFRTHEKSQV